MATYTTKNVVRAKTADELAAQYGVVNKQADFANTLNAATEAKFNTWDTQMKGVRDQQLTDYASQFGQYQQYARQNRANALRSGLSRGSTVAQEVMSQVQNQAYGAQNQTNYQQQLADIAAQKGAQKGADIYNALNMANETNLALANLSTAQQQTETTGQAAYSKYLSDMALANAQKYAADQNVVASSVYGTGNSDTAYRLALDSLGDKDLAFQVAYGDMSFEDAKKSTMYDAAGFPKNASEGATFMKDNYAYKLVGGKWQLQMQQPPQNTYQTPVWNWAELTSRRSK